MRRPSLPLVLILGVVLVSSFGLLHFHNQQKLSAKPLAPVPQIEATSTTPCLAQIPNQNSYNPAMALNIPSLTNSMHPPFPAPSADKITAPPASLLAFYRRIPNSCENNPNIANLRIAMQYHIKSSPPLPDELAKDNFLVIHVVSSKVITNRSTSLSDLFIRDALFLAEKFEYILLLPHATQGTAQHVQCADLDLLQSRLRARDLAVNVLQVSDPDESARFMASSKNLLVHRGSHSALGALVCGGTVYYTPDMSEYFDHNAYLWMVRNHQPAMPLEPRHEQRFMLDAMGPVQSSCCRFEAFGTGDGEKIACSNAHAFSEAVDGDVSCWVLSLGCGGRWDFEKDIAKRTECHIHTFDCTSAYEVPDELKERVTYHELCLGSEEDEREDFIGWIQMLDLIENRSAAGVPRYPALAKMDIEGWEFVIVREMLMQGKPDELPEQFVMEVHTGGTVHVGDKDKRKEVMSAWFGNLTTLGYQLVHRADNPYCVHCSEVTLVKNDGLPGAS